MVFLGVVVMKEEHLSDYKAQEYNVLYVYLSSKKSECSNTILLYKLESFLNAKTRFFILLSKFETR